MDIEKDEDFYCKYCGRIIEKGDLCEEHKQMFERMLEDDARRNRTK